MAILGTMTSSERRKSYLSRIRQNQSLEDIYSEDRKKEWESFSSEDQKKIEESLAFIGFVSASDLPIDPLCHENEDPPLPDIRSTLDGVTYYFELGEITDEGLARRASRSRKTGQITFGFFSQEDPLLKMLREKCARSYPTKDAPVDLLLYYSKQYPHAQMLAECLAIHEAEITGLIGRSQYARVWIYSTWGSPKVLWKRLRSG